MQIAKIENGQVIKVGHYREIFPNTSFRESGPTQDFLNEQGCVPVTMWLDHDQETEALQMCAPYLKDGKVYLVEVVSLSEEVINQRIETQQKQNLENAKAQRAAAVERIVVTVSSGKQFDGDEDSQNRMTRAIIALDSANVTTTQWKLADNSWVEVTIDELKQALQLAGAAQTAVWEI